MDIMISTRLEEVDFELLPHLASLFAAGDSLSIIGRAGEWEMYHSSPGMVALEHFPANQVLDLDLMNVFRWDASIPRKLISEIYTSFVRGVHGAPTEDELAFVQELK